MMIYMWGIGGGAARYIDKWIPLEKIDGFIVSDKRHNPSMFMGRPVYSPEEISTKSYDAIIVASVYVENIYRECMDYHLDVEKIIFLQRNCGVDSKANNNELLKKIFRKHEIELIENSSFVIAGLDLDTHDTTSETNSLRHVGLYGADYVRLRTFDLLADEILSHEVTGNIAELGVFRGDFSYYLNKRFPDRRLYLFDTFSGFDEEEIRKEISHGNAGRIINHALKNTTIDIVLKKMPYRAVVDIRQGYFPETLDGLEDIFAFVSIDVDLETSIYNGLAYFYPRLTRGGYIMIHDYNSTYKGVRDAVLRYERECETHLCKVPICDTSGTLVITR